MNIYCKSLLIAVSASIIITFLFAKYLNNTIKVAEIIKESNALFDMEIRCIQDKDPRANIAESIRAFERRITFVTNQYEIRQITQNSFYAKLFHVSDTAFLKSYLLTSFSLSFQELYTIGDLSSLIEAINDFTRPPQKTKGPAIASDKLTEVLKGSHNDFTQMFFDKVQFIDKAYVGLAIVKIKDTAWVDSILNHPLIKKKLPPDLKFMYGKYQTSQIAAESLNKLTLYGIRYKDDNKLNESSIARAYLDYDKEINQPSIQIEFNHTGTYLFAELTHANINKPISLISGKNVLTAAWVYSPIENGICKLSGGFTLGECDQFCKRVQAGNLPSYIHGSVKITQIKKERTSAGRASPSKYMLVIFFAAFIISFLATFLIFRTLSAV